MPEIPENVQNIANGLKSDNSSLKNEYQEAAREYVTNLMSIVTDPRVANTILDGKSTRTLFFTRYEGFYEHRSSHRLFIEIGLARSVTNTLELKVSETVMGRPPIGEFQQRLKEVFPSAPDNDWEVSPSTAQSFQAGVQPYLTTGIRRLQGSDLSSAEKPSSVLLEHFVKATKPAFDLAINLVGEKTESNVRILRITEAYKHANQIIAKVLAT